MLDSIKQVKDTLILMNKSASFAWPVSNVQEQAILEIPVTNWAETPRATKSQSWEVLVVLVMLTVFALIRRFFSNKFNQYFNAFTSNRFIGQLTREERSSENLSNLLFQLLYLMIVALFISELLDFFKPNMLITGLSRFFLFFLIVLAFHVVKLVVNSLIGWLLDLQLVITDFLFYRFISQSILGLVLFPVIVLLLFSYWDTRFLIGAGVTLVGLFYAYRLVRIVQRFWQEKRFLTKYFILYICGLEILPALLIAKYTYNTL